MKAVIVGLSEFGKEIAINLSCAQHEVIVLDNDLKKIEAIKDSVDLAICTDGENLSVYEDHNLTDCNIFICGIFKNFKSMVMITSLAKKMKIKEILAVAIDSDHKSILSAVGATTVIQPEIEAASIISQRLTLPEVKKYYELTEGFSVVEVEVLPFFVGKTLLELDLRKNFSCNLIGVSRKQHRSNNIIFNTVFPPDMAFDIGDMLYLAGSDLDLAKLLQFK